MENLLSGLVDQAPLSVNGFLVFSLLILAGLAGGQLASRTGVLPRISGYVASGFVLGPGILGLISADMLAFSQPFIDVALGLILFQLGRLLDVPAILHERSLLLAALLESTLTFWMIFAVLVMLGIDSMHAALAGAIGISSSPAVVLMVVKELNAEGSLTQSTLKLVAMNNILAFLVFTALLPFLHYAQSADWFTVILQPLYKLLVSLLLAYLLSQLMLFLARLLGQNEGLQFALLVGVIVGGIGLAKLSSASMLLTLLALGLLTQNLDRRGAMLPVDFGHGGYIFFVILFVTAGASLHVHDLLTAGWAAVAFVAARYVGKTLGVMVLYPRVLPREKALLCGFTLLPMAGMAIGLTRSTAAMYPEFAATLSAIVLGAIAILETIGPIATEYALKRSGEVPTESRLDH